MAFLSDVRTHLPILVSLICGLVCSGCFRTAATLKINADGSGTLVTRTIVLSAADDRLHHLFTVLGADSKDTFPSDLPSDGSLRRAASEYGATLVSSTPIEEADGTGLEATFSFRDINAVSVAELIGRASQPDGSYLESSTQPLAIQLQRNAGGAAVLRARLSVWNRENAQPFARNTNQALEQSAEMAIMRDLLQGAHFVFAIEPNGTIVRATTPYVDGQRVTLLDLQPEMMLTDEFAMKMAGARTDEEKNAVIADAAGAKIALAPEVTIEFMPK